jgi:acyl carrier protein
MEQNNKEEQIAKRIRVKLAEEIGVELDDIKEEDTFSDDLHMSPSEFSDFLSDLNIEGVEIAGLDIDSTSSVGELIEAVTTHLLD